MHAHINASLSNVQSARYSLRSILLCNPSLQSFSSLQYASSTKHPNLPEDNSLQTLPAIHLQYKGKKSNNSLSMPITSFLPSLCCISIGSTLRLRRLR
jgi:hypothetical protein